MSNKNGSHWIRDKKRRRIYERDGHRCVWCLKQVVVKVNATLDHFLPRELGGTNHVDNLITACLRCNSSRKQQPALLFAASLGEPHVVLDRVFEALDRGLP